MLIDAHFHLSQEDVKNNIINVMAANNLCCLTAATNPQEGKWLQILTSTSAEAAKFILPAYGLHPWQAGQYEVKDMVPYLEGAACIGEIGMDSVWCHVDTALQRRTFIAQMDLAEEKRCPVILHTKGQEKEIAGIITDYTVPVLVHWYSCENYLDLYLARDCYFTVGPDVSKNKAVRQVVKEVPLNRLFVESDGLSALEWARGEKIEAGALPVCLRETMAYIAAEKGLSFSAMEEQMEENFKRYFYAVTLI